MFGMQSHDTNQAITCIFDILAFGILAFFYHFGNCQFFCQTLVKKICLAKLDTDETYDLVPNLDRMDGRLARGKSSHHPCTGIADRQPPNFARQIDFFFFSWMVGDFLFWCRAIWCMGLGLTTQIVVAKNGTECQIFGMAKKPVLR